MYARGFKCKDQKWRSVFRQSSGLIRSNQSRCIHSHFVTDPCRDHRSRENVIRKFRQDLLLVPGFVCGGGTTRLYGRSNALVTCINLRFYSSKGDGRNASEGKHVPVKDSASFDKGKARREKIRSSLLDCDDHARLGEHDQQEWLNSEKLSVESKRKESPFLTRRQRFKNEFLRRVVPWEKMKVCWDTFPYHIDDHSKSTLVECAASHLKNKKFAASYGSRLASSTGRILLQSFPGTELYLERLVRALAVDLQVPLLVLDGSVLTPHDFGEELVSESDTDDENAESGEECTSDSEVEEEWASGSEARSDSTDEDAIDAKASAEVLKKLVPYNTLEELKKRVSGESECTSATDKSDAAETPQQSKRPLRKGDRVKYVGSAVRTEVENRIILGKIPTSDGPINAYTFISGRPLSSGQRGEVYEVNGDQVAVILDSSEDDMKDVQKDEGDCSNEARKPSIYWFDVQDIEHDLETEAEDWYIALEALCEVLPSLQPLIVYFPDPSQWLSRSVPKAKRKQFISKVEEMLDQLSGPVVLICGQNKVDSAPKDKEKLTMVFPNIRLGRLPIPLKQLTESLTTTKTTKDDGLYKLFSNIIFVHPPKEEELLRVFNKQIEEDGKIVVSRRNLCELQKVLEEHDLSCMELMHINFDDVNLTKLKAEKVVGWARNHYLSSCILPSIKADKLAIPRESIEIAISRLKELETTFRKPVQSLKAFAKDEYESNFVSAVVPPDEVGVKFDDIGALEDVKRTLNELVILPMRRPELFSRGNLLRPCKGILLFGPPGTGKTLLAKALATEAGANFISITGSTLTSKWFGDAEKLTKALFSFATKLAPVIIFVDEVDSLLGARGGAFEHEATRRMRNEFMAAWDGLRTKDSQRILILGATNRPFDLDDAVIRRLPRRIYIDLPDAANRMKILRIFLAHENLEPGFRYDELANATEGYSGSDLKNLCIAAAYRPVQELLEEEKKIGALSAAPVLRPLHLDDFVQAKAKVGASVAYDAASMNELRKWNDQYGEGGSRKQSPFGFGD